MQEQQRERKRKTGMLSLKEHERWVYLVFVIMITVQLASIIYWFQLKKEGWHSDEIWSYGYSNSYYQNNIYLDENNELINVNEWVDGKVFRDYLMVNKGQQFKYDSVYHNQINDLSPPLHSMILHTICSFFPETFSFWYSFLINIASFIVCMIYLFKSTRILKGDFFALCCCAVYGFSMGARDTYIYLRMYGMCTAFMMVILYNLLSYMKQSKSDGKIINKYLVALCVTAYLSFLTHYYMVSIVGLITFFVCMWMLFQKKVKQMFLYGFSMLFSLVLSIVTYPSLIIMSCNKSITAAEQIQEMLNYNFEMRFRILLSYITMKLYSISVSLYPSNWHRIVFAVLIYCLLISLPLLFLCRHTSVVKTGWRRICFLFQHGKSIIRYFRRRINGIYIILFLVIILQMIVVGQTSNIAIMGSYIDRYLLYMYPLAVIVGMAAIFQIGIIILKKKRYCNYLILFMSILLCVLNVYNQNVYRDYLFLIGEEREKIDEYFKGASCIYIEEVDWFLTAMVPELMYTDACFRVSPENCNKYKEEYMQRISDQEVILLVNCSFKYSFLDEIEKESSRKVDSFGKVEQPEITKEYKDVIDFFENLEPSSKMKKVSEFTIFERPFEMYIINP